MIPKHLLIATDFSEASERALCLGRTLQQQLGSKVEVIHVHLDPIDGYDDVPRESVWTTSKQYEAYMMGLEQMLKQQVEKAFGEDAKNINTEILRGQPANKILEQAKLKQADLICVGTTGKGAVERWLLGSVAQSLVRKSDVPVLTVH